jgi:hypothetical protein
MTPTILNVINVCHDYHLLDLDLEKYIRVIIDIATLDVQQQQQHRGKVVHTYSSAV